MINAIKRSCIKILRQPTSPCSNNTMIITARVVSNRCMGQGCVCSAMWLRFITLLHFTDPLNIFLRLSIIRLLQVATVSITMKYTYSFHHSAIIIIIMSSGMARGYSYISLSLCFLRLDHASISCMIINGYV